ncbi:unnamed protein product [Prunus armeniaca]
MRRSVGAFNAQARLASHLPRLARAVVSSRQMKQRLLGFRHVIAHSNTLSDRYVSLKSHALSFRILAPI